MSRPFTSVTHVDRPSAFSAGTVIHRVAMSCPEQVAIVGRGGVTTYRALADSMVGIADAIERSGEAGPLVAPAALSAPAMYAALGAWLSGGHVDEREGRPIPTPAPTDRQSAGWRDVASRPMSDLALVRSTSGEFGRCGWTHERLSYGWCVSSALPGAVSLALGNLLQTRQWSAVFGVLLARGRVVMPETSDWTSLCDAIRSERVTVVDLLPSEVHALGAAAVEPCPDVRVVRVWAEAPFDPKLLDLAQAAFPRARVERVLEAFGMPIAVASRDELGRLGANHLGSAVPGVRLSCGATGRVCAESTFFGPLVLEGDDIAPAQPATFETRLRAGPAGNGRLELMEDH